MKAKIRYGFVARMDIAAREAKLGSADPRLDAAGGHDATHNPMLAPLEIDYVPRPELGEPEKARAVDRVRLHGPGNQGADGGRRGKL